MDSISVVIPLYNKAPHIGRALNSIICQTHPADEIIVIDDGSTDGGDDVVKSIQDSRVRYIRQENQGVSAARNRGIAVAKGELIAFLDSDDAWRPEFLETIKQMRELYPEAGAYATAYTIISPDGSTFDWGVDPLEKGKERELLDNIFKEGMIKPIWSSAVAIPKKVFDEVGGFPEGEWYMEDLETWMRIGLQFPIARCNRELATYHQNAVNRVYQVNKIKHEPIFCHTARRALEEGKVPVDLIEDFREYVAFWQYHVIGNLIFTDQKSLARKLIDETKGTSYHKKWSKRYYFFSYFPASINYGIRDIIRFYFKIKKRIIKNNN